jgi:hypothetical protein
MRRPGALMRPWRLFFGDGPRVNGLSGRLKEAAKRFLVEAALDGVPSITTDLRDRSAETAAR